MSTGRDGVRAKTLSHELEHGHHLLARHVELLDDLVDAEILEVLEDEGNSATCRSPASRFGAGATSTTFWCRLCTEQSRS